MRHHLKISPAINLDGISPEELKAEFVKREELLTALVSRLRSQAHGNNDLLSAEQLKQLMILNPPNCVIEFCRH